MFANDALDVVGNKLVIVPCWPVDIDFRNKANLGNVAM
jgi:hypothetical protein